MLTPIGGRDTGTNDLDGMNAPHNSGQRNGSVFVPFLLPLGERFRGAGARRSCWVGGVEGEGKAHPLQIFRKKIFRQKLTNYNMQNRLLIDCLITLLITLLITPLITGAKKPSFYATSGL